MTETSRQFTSKQRKNAADQGHAMDDGSFPIKTIADLRNAIAAVGRASDAAAAKRHIRKRARELNALFLIPSGWEKAAESASGPSATAKDKNPNGGLSPAGRRKFGVKPGVRNYSSAGDSDKRRWVRWALRFTKTPRPLTDDKGRPTRYALMFTAWGEPVPSTADAVRKVHAKAIARAKQLGMGQYEKADDASAAELAAWAAEITPVPEDAVARRARIAAAVTVPVGVERHNFLSDADNRCLTCSQIQDHPVHGVTNDPSLIKQLMANQKVVLPHGERTSAELEPDDDAADADAAGRLAQGIDAGVDGALVLLRSTPDLPPYAAQAQALLQGIEPACDELLEYFGVPDADDDAAEAEDEAVQDKLAEQGRHTAGHEDATASAGSWTSHAALTTVRERTEPEAPAAELTSKAFLTQAGGRTLLTAPASVFTTQWEKALTPNEHMLWLQGRFVGAEKANRNGAFWSTADLEMGEPTVKHGPLNWLHEAKHVIGTIADAQLVHPPLEVAAAPAEPHIMAMAAVWKWIYPSEAFVIEEASDQNKLWYSMECVSREVACAGEAGCGERFAYLDVVRAKANVCEHIKGRSSMRHFVDPTFLGGAVIVPPVRPGWADADARVLREAAALAETSYEQACPVNMTASEWERLMAEVVGYALR